MENLNILQKFHQLSDRVSTWWGKGEPGKAENYINQRSTDVLFQKFGRALDKTVDLLVTDPERSGRNLSQWKEMLDKISHGKPLNEPEDEAIASFGIIRGMSIVAATVGIVASGPISGIVYGGFGLLAPKVFERIYKKAYATE